MTLHRALLPVECFFWYGTSAALATSVCIELLQHKVYESVPVSHKFSNLHSAPNARVCACMFNIIQHVNAVLPGLGTVDTFFNVFLPETLARE